MGTILMKGQPSHCCQSGHFSQENFCEGGGGVASGGKDIFSVWEKSCVSGSLQSVRMEMGSFGVEFSEEKKFTLFPLYFFSPYFPRFFPLFFYYH